MINDTISLSEIYLKRKNSVPTLLEIHLKKKLRRIDSYKKVFDMKKNIEKGKEKEIQEKNMNRNKQSSTTQSLPVVNLNHTEIQTCENNSFVVRKDSRRKYSLMHLKYKTILQNMEEFDQKIKVKAKRIKSSNHTHDFNLNINSLENNLVVNEPNISHSLEKPVPIFYQSVVSSPYQIQNSPKSFLTKIQTHNQENKEDLVYNKTFKANRKIFSSSCLGKENKTSSQMNIKNNKIFNNKINMYSKMKASITSTTSAKNIRKPASKLETGQTEKEKFKNAVLSKTKTTKSSTDLTKSAAKTSLIRKYGLITKAISGRKSVTNTSKTFDNSNKANDSQTIYLPSSESVLEKEKADTSRNITSLDFNESTTKNVEVQTENLQKGQENEVYKCDLSNIYEDSVEKEKEEQIPEEKATDRKSIILIEDEKKEEINMGLNSPTDKTVINSVNLTIKNSSFQDLIINKVNEINIVHENNNNTTIKDKHGVKEDWTIVDNLINFSIKNKEKEKNALLMSQAGFNIITTKIQNHLHTNSEDKKGNGIKFENQEIIVPKEEKENAVDESNEFVNQISENINIPKFQENLSLDCKKSFEEDRIKIVDDNNFTKQNINDFVNMKEVDYDNERDSKQINISPHSQQADTLKDSKQYEFNDILVRNKKFSELLEIIDKPVTENNRYDFKNIFKTKENNFENKNFDKSKNEENLKSIKNNIDLSKKIASLKDSIIDRSNFLILDLPSNYMNKKDTLLKQNETLNINIHNDICNTNTNEIKRDINTVCFRNFSPENNTNFKKNIINDGLNNKFLDERLATNFTHKYIKKDLYEAQNKSPSNNLNRYNNLYSEINEKTNKGRNIKSIIKETKYTINNLNGPKTQVTSSIHIDNLKSFLEFDKIKNKGKLPVIEIIQNNRYETYIKRNIHEERLFNIMPTNDIDLRQVRINKCNAKQLINTKY